MAENETQVFFNGVRIDEHVKYVAFDEVYSPGEIHRAYLPAIDITVTMSGPAYDYWLNFFKQALVHELLDLMARHGRDG